MDKNNANLEFALEAKRLFEEPEGTNIIVSLS
jgi:hypothetical protein